MVLLVLVLSKQGFFITLLKSTTQWRPTSIGGHGIVCRDFRGNLATDKVLFGFPGEIKIVIPGIFVVMLAGHMRSSFLRDALEVPTVLLPLRRSATVLEAWLEILDEAFVSEVCIALNLGSDTHIIDTAIRSITRKRAFRSVVKTVLEPAAWRGPGGVIRDLTLDLEPDTIIVVVEGNSAPVSSARDVISAVQGGADGAVGVCDSNSPAGISAFRRAIFEQVPKIGYFDLKEQLLPALHDSSFQVRPVSVLRGSSRIHDRVSYLEAIGRELSVENQVVTYSKEQAQTVIAETAVIDGKCLIESGVSVGDEAVVHDSVILQGEIGRASCRERV